MTPIDRSSRLSDLIKQHISHLQLYLNEWTKKRFSSLGAVEVTNGRVTVCRDAVKGHCQRPGSCKYYHIPWFGAATPVSTGAFSRPVITWGPPVPPNLATYPPAVRDKQKQFLYFLVTPPYCILKTCSVIYWPTTQTTPPPIFHPWPSSAPSPSILYLWSSPEGAKAVLAPVALFLSLTTLPLLSSVTPTSILTVFMFD